MKERTQLQIQGNYNPESKLDDSGPSIKNHTYNYNGTVLEYVDKSDRMNLIPTSFPIGALAPGGEIHQIVVMDEEANLFEAYVYAYTKHVTNEKRFILNDLGKYNYAKGTKKIIDRIKNNQYGSS